MNLQASNAKDQLSGTVKGSVLIPDEPRYEEARRIWNAMIDRRPALIVQCAEADDVVTRDRICAEEQTGNFDSRWRA